MGLQDTLTALANTGEADTTERTPTEDRPMTDGGTTTTTDTTTTDTTTAEWTAVDPPVEKTLNAVATTVVGPLAVGAGGKVVARRSDGWEVVVPAGPAAKRNTLTDAAVSSDGKRLWFAGGSGALGVYDVEQGRKYDYTAPGEKTSTWEAIAVTGPPGEEQLRVANGSGEVLSATIDEQCCPAFGEVVKPGSGSTINGLAFGGASCYAIDTSGNVFVERSDGWERIGIRNAQVNFFDLSGTEDDLSVAAGGGLVYRYDYACDNWTPVKAGEGALQGIARRNGRRVVVGAGGRIYAHSSDRGWHAVVSPVESTLADVTLGGNGVDVAVGADGTLIERA